MLGGGTHAGFLGDVAIQLLAVPLLALTFWRLSAVSQRSAGLAPALCWLGLLAAIVLIQLAPLPDFLLTLLNQRAAAIRAFDDAWQSVIGHGQTPAGLSLVPDATAAAAASLIVPASVFLAVSCSSKSARRQLAGLVVLIACLTALLGLTQIAQGPSSPLRFYAITNDGAAVGLFANRNHFATFLSVALLLGAPFLLATQRRLKRDTAMHDRSLAELAGLLSFGLVLIAAILATQSRAGLVLAGLAAVAVVVLAARPAGWRRTSRRPAKMIAVSGSLLVAGLAVLFITWPAADRTFQRFTNGFATNQRIALTQATLTLAGKNMPFGTGLGSFRRVYAAAQADGDVGPNYVNRAHNDYAELLLEAGLPGGILALLFLAWFAVRLRAVWRRPLSRHDRTADALLPQAASIAVVLLLIHSVVDYPLRTTALSTLFAMCCGLLIDPPGENRLQDEL